MPTDRTALIIIHGIGEQNPFETLDPFVQGLRAALQSRGSAVNAAHRMAPRTGATGAPWNESYIRLAPADASWHIDVHEYYWAYLTEKKVSVGDVFRWVSDALTGTKNFAKDNAATEKRFENSTAYAHRMRSIYWMLRLVYPLVWLLQLLPRWSSALRWIGEAVDRWGTAIIVGYLGDVAIYTTTDEKSANYRIRQRILAESQALVDAVLKGERGEGYDRVIIAGHSLGSVIAFDTLNRINIALSMGDEKAAGALAGLITFGSPLDKIAFFFRERTKDKEGVRRQILAHLHSFKAKQWDDQRASFPVSNPITPALDGMPWVNYYCDKDPVSGHLDWYAIDERDNVKLTLPEPWGAAHIGYWNATAMYADIVTRFFC